MLPSFINHIGKVHRLNPCLTNMVRNLHISSVQQTRGNSDRSIRTNRGSHNSSPPHATFTSSSSSSPSSSMSSTSSSSLPASSSSTAAVSSINKEASSDSVEKSDAGKENPHKNNEPGLMEFFDDPVNWGETVVRVGRAWLAEELRIKSNSDLHKLWFVLLKEKNMLLTMKEECDKNGFVFPSPERIDKMDISMRNLEKVVRERNRAYFQLEVGEDATAEREMAFRPDPFGRWDWQQLNEHYRPYLLSKKWRTVFGIGYGNDVNDFMRKWRERRRNAEYAKLSSQHKIVRQLLRRFPDIDLEYLQRKFPKVPVEYYKNNLNFQPEYKRLVSKGAYLEAH